VEAGRLSPEGEHLHPIERLRMVARAGGEDPGLVAQEAAAVLAACADDPPGLVTACRRLVDHQPAAGPVWWVAARVLAAPDAEEEAWHAAERLADDPTPAALAFHLPDDVLVTVVGWPDQAAAALHRRGDCSVLVVDGLAGGASLATHLRRAGTEAVLVGEAGLGPAVVASGLVLLEATALGPGGFVAATGSMAAAAVGRQAGVPVWVVAGAGRVLPGALWEALVSRLAGGADPWDRPHEVVPLSLADRVVGADGPRPAEEAPAWADCPVVPELTRSWPAPGTRGGGRAAGGG
jgi:hypothetical protein